MSSATVTPPPVRASAVALVPHKWALAEYRRLAESGLFDDRKTMLVRGELFVMPLPDPPHDEALGLIDDWLRAAIGPNFHVRAQMAFDASGDSDPGPDIAVVAGTRREMTGCRPTTAALVVEVASSSLALDTTAKAELYATAGVPDYWVLDLNARVLHIFRDPQANAALGVTTYRAHTIRTETESAAPLVVPDASVQVGALLPAPA
jgi:Uma2 family endonuclease